MIKLKSFFKVQSELTFIQMYCIQIYTKGEIICYFNRLIGLDVVNEGLQGSTDIFLFCFSFLFFLFLLQ